MKNSFNVPLEVLDSIIHVDIFKTDFNQLKNNLVPQNIIDSFHGVYCFYNQRNIYIGEANNPFQRLEQHFHSKKLKQDDHIIVFRSSQFHKSATYDIETRLIDFFNAEQKLHLENTKTNQGDYKYFLKYAYQDVIKKIWSYLKYCNVATKDIKDIENMQIFKLSPYKSLNLIQQEVVSSVANEVLKEHSKSLTIVNGYPGTGKSIVASKLYGDLSKTKKVCLTSGTHHTVKAFQNVFNLHQKDMKTGSLILKTSQLLKSKEKFDIVIIDEAHRLSKRSGKGHPNKYAHIEQDSNELEMIRQIANNVIILYDQNQIVHDGDIFLSKKEVDEASKFNLKEQMHSMSGYEYISWFMEWLSGHFRKIDHSNYDLRVYDDFSKMYKDLKSKSKKQNLTRLTSGYTRKWVSKNNPNKYDFKIDGIKLKWNNTKSVNRSNWMDSKAAINLEEVAYYHVVQGFDMHYNGVIIGKDLYLDENDELQVNEKYVVHSNQKPNKKDKNYQEELRKWVLNRYKILLSRGAIGTYLFIEDKKLREKIKSLL